MSRWLLVLFLALASPAHSETLDNPYGECDRQTLDTAVALERLGDREVLREHVRSFGCRLMFPDEAFRPFAPERRRERMMRDGDGGEARDRQ
jgi:hypothetical protein